MRRRIREQMTLISDLAIVGEDSSLFEAILAIGAVSKRNPASGLRCPAALVSDRGRRITGVLDFRKMLRGLEPKYSEVADSAEKRGYSPERFRSALERHGLWADALDEICKKTGEILIKELMTIPGENQIIDADASLNEAVYQMVVTGYDYLFVKSGEALIGIISLSNIMMHICDAVKACRV